MSFRIKLALNEMFASANYFHIHILLDYQSTDICLLFKRAHDEDDDDNLFFIFLLIWKTVEENKKKQTMKNIKI